MKTNLSHPTIKWNSLMFTIYKHSFPFKSLISMNNKMDSSNNSCNYNNTILSFQENDINPTQKLDDPYSLFNFPDSPQQYSNMEYESLCLNQIYHHLLSDQLNTENPPELNPMTKLTPTKSIRSSKKDRHSKINTARGPRDRRMRLSLDVARKFFDLQDMLGYDKASRTVDWLLKNSSLAIIDLERGRNMGANYGSSTNSESCEQEVLSSGIDNLSGVWENGKNEERSSVKQVKKKVKKERKVLARPIVEKESRKRARERARVRASQKRRLLSNEQQKPCGDKNDNQLMVVKSRERDEIFDESLSFEMPWNYSSTHENGISHQQHLGEFPFCGKPWEAQNSCN